MTLSIKVQRILDCLFAALLLAWFLSPQLPSVGLTDVAAAPAPAVAADGAVTDDTTSTDAAAAAVQPFRLPWLYRLAFPGSLTAILLFGVYLVPLYFLWKLLTIFLGDKLRGFGQPAGWQAATLRIAITVAAGLAAVLPLLALADRPAWFAQLPVFFLVGLPLILIMHVLSVIFFLNQLNQLNPAWREYKEYKGLSTRPGVERRARKLVPKPVYSGEERRATSTALPVLVDFLLRIRTKLFLAFVGIIAFILLTLSGLLLNNYRQTIMDAVTDGASSQVEQAAAIYRVNLGDVIAIHEYMNRQLEMNARAGFPWESLTIYSHLREELYLDELEPDVVAYAAEFSTQAPNERYPGQPALAAEAVAALLPRLASGERIIRQENADAGTIGFSAPIIKIDTIRSGDDRIRRERLLGLAVMTFDADIIMRPYFMTRNTVIAFTLLFLYLSVILTYLVGNYIVNPLLFLRMNVRKISDSLTTMIRGQSRVSSASLVYVDHVKSRDEIKQLSGEIGEMVTVIKGIIPYISASTLKQAEKGSTSSVKKELAFLFTDIRGFTTLCEGLAAEEVVSVLNRYLDLETEIILNNHGDIDKFVGDELMAFFEGPERELNACRAAMQLVKAMTAEAETRTAAGQPIVNIGIGVNSGSVVFGSVGARDRMDFTSIGDTVNLAARLEGANKAYGTRSLISEAVWERVKEHFICREIDLMTVKGKSQPVRIYEIMRERGQLDAPGGVKADGDAEKFCQYFEKAIAAYRQRKWEVAGKAFQKLAGQFKDEAARVYLDRIAHFQAQPPAADWDGVFRMTVK